MNNKSKQLSALCQAIGNMCVNLTHNDNIRTFDDVTRHVELEEDRLHADKPINIRCVEHMSINMLRVRLMAPNMERGE